MNKKEDEFNRFLPEERLDKDKLSIEIPAEQRPMQHDRVPSGYEPMGRIQLEGRVFRGLASGQVRWWVLITGWIIFGSFALSYAVVMSSSFAALTPLAIFGALIALAIEAIPLLILWRGTKAKLSNGRRRRW